MNYSRDHLLLDQLIAQNKPAEVKTRSPDRNSEEDEQEDDEHFGGGAANPGNEPGSAEPEDAPPPYTEEELAEAGNIKYAEPSIEAVQSTGLRCPVVIPQRRPGSKTRGFIRAYAPVLADFDIDQETFLGFLKAFHKASQVCRKLLSLYAEGTWDRWWSLRSAQWLTTVLWGRRHLS